MPPKLIILDVDNSSGEESPRGLYPAPLINSFIMVSFLFNNEDPSDPGYYKWCIGKLTSITYNKKTLQWEYSIHFMDGDLFYINLHDYVFVKYPERDPTSDEQWSYPDPVVLLDV